MRLVGVYPRQGYRKKNTALAELIACGLISANQPEIDKVGRTSYDSVIAQDVVGDGATYITFLNYTDADLPDNYEIEAEFYYETTSTVGLYGFNAQTGNRTFLVTTSGSFISRFFEAQVTAILTPNIGQRYKVKSVVSPTEYEFFVDGVSYGSAGYIKNISNKPIELLTLGEMLLPATHNLISFKITDLDTGEYIQLINEERQSDGITLLKKYDAQGNFIENIMGEQFFSPAIPTVDNNFRRSEANEKGVSIADGSQFMDEALVYPYQIGTPITADSKGLLTAWIDNGQGVGIRTSVDARGPIKMDMRVVDGVVDNGVDNANLVTFDAPNVIVGDDYIEYDTNGTFLEAENQTKTLKDNTEYVVVFEVLETTISAGTNYSVFPVSTGGIRVDLDVSTIGEKRGLITNGTSQVRIDMYTRSGTTGENLKVSTPVFYENTLELFPTDPLTDPLPTSGSFESGNSIISADIYGKRNNADTNEILRNPDGTPKLIVYDDMANITYQQMYVSEDKQKILFFGEPLDVESKCFEKALKFVDVIEPLQTTEDTGVENAYTTENTGLELAYVYKDFVTEVK